MTFTDVVQFAFMLISIPLVAALSLVDAGGLSGIMAVAPEGFFSLDAMGTDVLKSHSILFVSYAVPALYPVIIQRMLMAKDTKQIKLTLWFNAGLSLFFFIMIAIIGMAALVLYPSLDAKTAFPALINESLPVGIKGLAIVGLLATVMSTVDSFLNLVGTSFVNDVLRPLLPKKLIERRELMLARTTTVVIGTTGLISALYFNGVLENVFASMNLWLPFVFPPLFIGIWRGAGSGISFLFGLGAAGLVLFMLGAIGIAQGFFATLLAAFANGFILLVASWRLKSAHQTNHEIDFLKKSLKRVGRSFAQHTEHADILGVFNLTISTIPTIAAVSAGVRPQTAILVLFVAIASLATTFILKDLWIEKRFLKPIKFLLPGFLVVAHVSSPLVNIFLFGLIALGVCDFIVGLLIIATLYTNSTAWFWNLLGVLVAMLIYPFLSTVPEPSLSTPLNLAFALRLLMLFYFFFKARANDKKAVKQISAINSALAHEVGHSIASMNLCARRLSISLPKVLQAFQEAPNSKSHEVTEEDLASLNVLANRLHDNALRTESTVRLLQQDWDAKTHVEPVSVMSMVKEAIDSGTANIDCDCITISGDDFNLHIDRGAVVHVLINLLKNAAEALVSSRSPRIEIFIDGNAKTISVGNNGPRIPQDDLAKLLKARFSTKGKGRGSGLVTCSMLLSRLNASMSLKSDSEFTLFFLHFENNSSGASS